MDSHKLGKAGISYMGLDENDGPFWGLYYSIFLIVYRGAKGAHNFHQPPHATSELH